MNSPNEQDSNSFRALVSAWEDAYVCAVYAYVAVKIPNEPRLLYGRIVSEPTRSGVSATPLKYETEHIVAGRFVNAIGGSDLDTIVTNAKVGTMEAGGGTISLASETSGNVSTYFAPIYHPFISDGPRIPSLLVRGLAKHGLLGMAVNSAQLDWELRAADAPFESVDELLGHCGLPMSAQSGDMTTLEVIAKSPALIGTGSVLARGEAVMECRAARGLDVGRLRLGYRIMGGSVPVVRASITGDKLQWADEGDVRVAFHRISVGEALLVQAFLSYDRVSLHQWWITDPTKHLNPRHAIHQAFDQDQELLRRILFTPETDKPYAFEGAVSALLSLLGFSVSNYGRIPKLQKGPDIIAVTPLGHVAVVECTVGLLNENDKLAKLVQRTKLIKTKLAEAGHGRLEVQATIVTPLSRGEVAADLEIAEEHGIAVVCKEDLERLASQVALPPNADRLFTDSRRLIPGSNPSLPFGRVEE